MTKIKNFAVDWDDYESVRQLFNQVKTRKLQIEPGRISKRQIQAAAFHAAWEIYQTDISFIYEVEIPNGSNDYYVYAHCDPTRAVSNKAGIPAFAASIGLPSMPFYIGKGVGNRAFDLNRNETHRKVRQKITKMGKEPSIVIIENGLSSQKALAAESKLIDIFGLNVRGGCLCNLDEGADSSQRQSLYKEPLSKLGSFNKQYFR